MKYLFFDIECANCFYGKYKICEFGYVLTDENFKIIRKDDIPMSPGDKNNRSCRFDLSIYEREPGFDWAYDIDYYYECPRFPKYYEFLKKLFEDKDTLAFGYAVGNDIRYLNSEFKRYDLEPLHYKVCDVQTIMKYYSEKFKEFITLTHAFEELCGNNELKQIEPHLSRDDAIMTMRVLQEMLKNLELSINDIFEIYPDSLYDANEYLENLQKKKEQKALKRMKYKLENERIEFRKSFSDLVKEEESKGKICTISSLCKTDKETLNKAINYIKNNNLIAYNRISRSDFVIVVDEKNREEVLSSIKKPFDGQFILLSEIKEE